MNELVEQLKRALGDGFLLERELGGGGMSRVYLAQETALARSVVVKVLPPELAAGVSVDRFRREIALAASMQHPHIVPLLTAGTDRDLLWFTMPFIDGQSLRARLARGGELPVPEAVRMLREVADALAYAHRRGVVHRDIKPENILLSEGHAMVTDFGVAKAIAESAPEATAMTGTGLALGTPAYMAPEQASADPNVDQRADIYAFGVLAFELLTGQPPFQGTNAAQVVRAHLTEPAPSAAQRREAVPAWLDAMIARCLAKRPADRPQTADELVALLESAVTPIPTASTTAAASTRAPSRGRLAAIAAVLLIGAAGGGYTLWSRNERVPSRPRVVVQPFVNATGDTAFNSVGTMIASWAQDAFTRTDVLDVADFRAVLEGDSAPGGSAGVTSLASRAGASRVLTGSVYRMGDSLEFRANIVDGQRATVVTVIPPVRASAAEPMRGIELLAERAAGALAVEESGVKSAFVGATHLPTLAAYREFVAGVDAYAADAETAVKAFRSAIAADSSFLSAHIWLARALGNLRRRSPLSVSNAVIDSIYAQAALRRAELSPLDQAVVDASIAGRSGDREREIVALRRAASLWPDRWATNLVQTLQYAGRPRAALEVAKTIDPTKGFVRQWATHYSSVVVAHQLTGDYDRAVSFAREGVARFPNDLVTLCPLITSLLLRGDRAEADSLTIYAMPSARESTVFFVEHCWSNIVMRAASVLPRDTARSYLTRHRQVLAERRQRAGTLPAGILTDRDAALLLGDYATQLTSLDSLLATPAPTVGARIRAMLTKAWTLAKLGRTAEARALRLQAIALPEYQQATRGGLADARTLDARVFVALGEREQAVRVLREAVGNGVIAYQVYYSPYFRELRGMPAFEAIVGR